MRSLLLSLCIFAVVIAAARGFSSKEAIDGLNEKTPDYLEDQLENFEDENNSKNASNPHDCDCDGVCEVLHYTRLPKNVRVRRVLKNISLVFRSTSQIFTCICTNMQYLQKSVQVQMLS